MHTVIDSKVGIRQIPQWQTHKKSYYDIDFSESTLEMIFSHNLVGMQIEGAVGYLAASCIEEITKAPLS